MMKKNSKSPLKLGISLLLLLFIFSQTSCSLHIEKRRYNKGYFVDIIHPVKSKNRTVSSNRIISKTNNQPVLLTKTNSTDRPLLPKVEVETNIIKIETIKKKNSKTIKNKVFNNTIPTSHNNKDCDVITLMDRTEIEVIIEEISETEVRYKMCNFSNGPTFSLSINNVKEIELRNGTIIKPDHKIKKEEASPIDEGVNIIATVLAGIGLLGIIFGIMLISVGSYFSLSAIIPLALGGIATLIGALITTKSLTKRKDNYGRIIFSINLALQILGIILVILIFSLLLF